MAFIDDMGERDLSLLQALDGRVVIYSPSSASPRAISAMLQEFTEMTGGAYVTSISYSASFDGLVEASFSFQGNGPLLQQTVT